MAYFSLLAKEHPTFDDVDREFQNVEEGVNVVLNDLGYSRKLMLKSSQHQTTPEVDEEFNHMYGKLSEVLTFFGENDYMGPEHPDKDQIDIEFDNLETMINKAIAREIETGIEEPKIIKINLNNSASGRQSDIPVDTTINLDEHTSIVGRGIENVSLKYSFEAIYVPDRFLIISGGNIVVDTGYISDKPEEAIAEYGIPGITLSPVSGSINLGSTRSFTVRVIPPQPGTAWSWDLIATVTLV